MTRVLTTQNAQITTASVEVKTLTISGKQVTQSVFRQLREVPLIAHDGTLNGVPWGYVNYHHDKCEKDTDQHLHVVWQSGPDLLRSRVNLVPKFDRADVTTAFDCESGHKFYTECVRLKVHGESLSHFNGEPIKSRTSGSLDYSEETPYIDVLFEGLLVRFRMSDSAYDASTVFRSLPGARQRAAEEETSGGSRDFFRRQLVKTEQRFTETVAALDAEMEQAPHVDDLFAALCVDVLAEVKRRQQHRDSVAAITALPHLFIAV